jgi:hypothetical protein
MDEHLADLRPRYTIKIEWVYPRVREDGSDFQRSDVYSKRLGRCTWQYPRGIHFQRGTSQPKPGEEKHSIIPIKTTWDNRKVQVKAWVAESAWHWTCLGILSEGITDGYTNQHSEQSNQYQFLHGSSSLNMTLLFLNAINS